MGANEAAPGGPLTGEEGLGGCVEHGEGVGDHGGGCAAPESWQGSRDGQRGWGGRRTAAACRQQQRPTGAGKQLTASCKKAPSGPTAACRRCCFLLSVRTASRHADDCAVPWLPSRAGSQGAAPTRARVDEAAAQLLGAHAGQQQVRDLHRAHGVALQVGHLLLRRAAAGGQSRAARGRPETPLRGQERAGTPRLACAVGRHRHMQGRWAAPHAWRLPGMP